MDKRDEFLRTWYTVLWSNIDRSMTSIWQIAGPIALVGAAFIAEDKLGVNVTTSLQLVILFWALNNTMDMNSWHRRNLIFVARVERQFLLPSDYGVVAPRSFREPRTDWIEFYAINFWTFCLLLGVVVVNYLVKAFRGSLQSLCSVLGPLTVLVIGSVFTAYTYSRCEKQIQRYFDETRSAD
jgi:hypothetical protein